MTNDGTVSPGLSPGTLTIQADYVQTPLGSLAVEVNGTTPGTDFDVLSVTGTASLDGHLGISTGASFTPSLGDTFKIVQAGTRTGTFASVSGLDLGGGNSYTVQYNPTDVTLAVGIGPVHHTLTVSVNGSGNVASNDGKIACPTDCSEVYDEGTPVTLTAIPDTGFSFTGWGGDCTSFGTDPCALTMSADKTASATFEHPPHAERLGDRLGPGDIGRWSDRMSRRLHPGLRRGNVRDSDRHRRHRLLLHRVGRGLHLVRDRSVRPDHGRRQDRLGDLRSHPPHAERLGDRLGPGDIGRCGIACPGDCIQVYDEGTSVTLTATADTGFSFTGWTGDCTGTDPCLLTIDTDKGVTATFQPIPHTLTVSVTGPGQVASDDGKIACPPDCLASYDEGTSVTLTGTPDSGFSFTGWGGDCIGTDPCLLTMDADKDVTATFEPIPPEPPSTPTGVEASPGTGWQSSPGPLLPSTAGVQSMSTR